MEREAELLKIYDEALTLSQGQGRAIEQENWELLQTLLDARERYIQRAEQLLTQPVDPAYKPQLAERLQRLGQLDESNQQLLNQKRSALQAEMTSLGRSKAALGGYLESFGSAFDPTFFDQDR